MNDAKQTRYLFCYCKIHGPTDREKADPGKDSPIMHIPLKTTQVMKSAIVLLFTQHTVSNNNKKGQWHIYMLEKDRCVDTTVTSKQHQRLRGVERRAAHVNWTDGSAGALRYPTSFFEIIRLKPFYNMTAASTTRGNSSSKTWQQQSHPNSPFPPSPVEVPST